MFSSHLVRRLCMVAAAALAVTMFVSSPSFSSVSSAHGGGGHHKNRAQLTVRTADGRLKGTESDGARAFLGVPYAAPPVYDLRFAPPQPAQPWRGVRDATRQAPACIQFQPSGVRNSQAVSEDCLYLDIYTPAHIRRGAKLPVVFWLHGGGNTQGTGVIYGGQRFATLTNSIFVSINYRLGAFGFLALPQLDGASAGSYGLLDQIAALKWSPTTSRRSAAMRTTSPSTVSRPAAKRSATCWLRRWPPDCSSGPSWKAILAWGTIRARSRRRRRPASSTPRPRAAPIRPRS
jgi:para-nitrobenzyl esterase